MISMPTEFNSQFARELCLVRPTSIPSKTLYFDSSRWGHVTPEVSEIGLALHLHNKFHNSVRRFPRNDLSGAIEEFIAHLLCAHGIAV